MPFLYFPKWFAIEVDVEMATNDAAVNEIRVIDFCCDRPTMQAFKRS